MNEKIELLEQEILRTESLEQKIDKMNELGQLLRLVDETKSFRFSEKAKTLSTTGPYLKKPYKKGLAYSLTNLSKLNLVKGNREISFSQGNEALKIFIEIKDFDGQAFALSVLGFSHYTLGNYTKSLNYLLESIHLARKTNNKKLEGVGLRNLAGVYSCVGDPVKMQESYERSLSIFREIDDSIGLATTQNNMAIDYKEAGDFDSALKYGLESLRISGSEGFHATEYYTLETIGSIYLAMENFEKARFYLERAYDNLIKMENEYAEIFILIRLAILSNKKNNSSAINYLKRALFLSEKLETISEETKIHKLLSQIYEDEGKPLMALYHYKKYHIVDIIVMGKINETKRLKEQLEKAKEEIKTLKGIIPICSHCKNIRDDSGYWNQIEAYIQEHSNAEFSHSMCPQCAEEFYGKEPWYENINKKELK